MFRFEDKLPPYLVNNSRDFLLMSRLDDLLFMGLREEANSVKCLNDSNHCHSEVLDLLGAKVGFFYTGYIIESVLRRIISSFKTIMKYKGTLRGVLMAVTCIQGENNSVTVNYSKQQEGQATYLKNSVDIYIGNQLQDKNALKQLLQYVLPTGLVYNVYQRTYEDYYKFLYVEGSYHVYVSGGRTTSASILSVLQPEDIPLIHNGVPVTKLADHAFQECKIVKLTIPTGLELGKEVLKDCSSLAELTIGTVDCLEELFYERSEGDTTSVNVPQSLKVVTMVPEEYKHQDSNQPSTVKSSCFSNTSVERVILSEGITTISENAFQNCTSLREISFPSTLTTISENAFQNCTSLRPVKFPAKLKEISAGAFDTSGSISPQVVFDLTEVETCPKFGENCFGQWSSSVTIKVPQSWYWEAMQQLNFSVYDGRIFAESIEKNGTLYLGNYAICTCGETPCKCSPLQLGTFSIPNLNKAYTILAGYDALLTTNPNLNKENS